jgi:hypothetical protein
VSGALKYSTSEIGLIQHLYERLGAVGYRRVPCRRSLNSDEKCVYVVNAVENRIPTAKDKWQGKSGALVEIASFA